MTTTIDNRTFEIRHLEKAGAFDRLGCWAGIWEAKAFVKGETAGHSGDWHNGYPATSDMAATLSEVAPAVVDAIVDAVALALELDRDQRAYAIGFVEGIRRYREEAAE